MGIIQKFAFLLFSVSEQPRLSLYRYHVNSPEMCFFRSWWHIYPKGFPRLSLYRYHVNSPEMCFFRSWWHIYPKGFRSSVLQAECKWFVCVVMFRFETCFIHNHLSLKFPFAAFYILMSSKRKTAYEIRYRLHLSFTKHDPWKLLANCK